MSQGCINGIVYKNCCYGQFTKKNVNVSMSVIVFTQNNYRRMDIIVERGNFSISDAHTKTGSTKI